MNEQQLADLFSEQLDHLLQGQTPSLPPEAADLQELLDFGQQFSQITFQPGTAAQATFQSQLASWFGPTSNGAATVWGLSKTLLFTLIGAAILVGIGVGITILSSSPDDSNGLSTPSEVPELPVVAPQDEEETPEPDTQTTPEPPKTSLEETIPDENNSFGDTVPSSPPSLGDTLSLPTSVPTVPAEDDVDTDVGSGEAVTNDTDGVDVGDDGTAGGDDDRTQEGDNDKGHGNDADGIDEDNPGNSSGVGGGNNQNQGGSGLGGVGRGDDNGDGQGGQGGSGGQGGGKGNGKGGGKGNKGNSGKK